MAMMKKPAVKYVIKKKAMKRDPFAEGIDPSAGRGLPLTTYRDMAPPKPKSKPQVVNRGAKSDKSRIVRTPPSKKMKKKVK